jgi:hypothetical protein
VREIRSKIRKAYGMEWKKRDVVRFKRGIEVGLYRSRHNLQFRQCEVPRKFAFYGMWREVGMLGVRLIELPDRPGLPERLPIMPC